MRTTLSIDDDVLQVAKTLAAQQQRTVGEVISDLARQSLDRPKQAGIRNGILLLQPKPRDPLVTHEDVNALRDDAHLDERGAF